MVMTCALAGLGMTSIGVTDPAASNFGPARLAARPVAASRSAAALSFTADGRAIAPPGYRDWPFLTAGIDMNYDATVGQPGAHVFDNVFVDPAALRAFRRTGRWPEGAVLVKESRDGLTKGSINKSGQFQGEAVTDLELHVKDTRRFGGWAFFSVSPGQPARARPPSDDCYACHGAHGAVDSTFVQFYPTLIGVARAKHTLAPEYRQSAAGTGG
ncbi:cytochrome P460 family protein [Novosphingobium sp.]|uniref:cytochrome P460 family protein n=1 Tax=Novosphingobium sp. TaxID=1874826 RepID=UPI0033401E7A